MGSGSKPRNVKSAAKGTALVDGKGDLDLDCPEDGLLEVKGIVAPEVHGEEGEITSSDDGLVLVTTSSVVSISASAGSRRLARCISQGRRYRGRLRKVGDAVSIRFWEVP